MKHYDVRWQYPATGREQNFWQFSLELYTRPGIARELLAGQSEHGIWINDWLFALWSAREGNIIEESFPAWLHAQWPARQLIRQWRTQRCRLQYSGNAIYRRWLDAEVALEWADQRFLARLVPIVSQPASAFTLAERALYNLNQVGNEELPASRELPSSLTAPLLSALAS